MTWPACGLPSADSPSTLSARNGEQFATQSKTFALSGAMIFGYSDTWVTVAVYGRLFVMQGSAVCVGAILVFGAVLGAACGGNSSEGRKTPAKVNGGGGEAGSNDGTGGTPGAGSGSTSGSSGGGSGGVAGSPPISTEPGFGDDPARNDVKAGALCERLATIQCAGEELCCDAPGRDFATCKSTMKAGCETTIYLDKISLDPRSGFDAARAKTVFETIETKAMACDPGTAAFGESTDGLRGIFQGTVAPKGPCQPDVGSKSKAAAALASCKDPGTNACLPNPPLGITWSCAPRSAAGGPCFTDINCNSGLYCPNPALVPVPASACAARKAVGAACTAPNECESLFCKGKKCVAADQQAAYCLKE